MEGKREAILSLHRAGKKQVSIAKSLGVTQSTVSKALKRYNEQGNFKDRSRGGRPRSKRSASKVKVIRERIRRNPKRSMRKMAKETGMSVRSLGRIVHNDLKMSSFTLQKRQSLSEAVKLKRLERSKVLLNELKSGMAGETIWSDEKIFTVELAHNRRNDRVLGKKSSDIPYDIKTVHRTMKPQSVMVWAAISKTWRSPLIFVEEKVKINAKVYIDKILQPMNASAKVHFGDDKLWTFQQDGATAHTANISQGWCRDNLPRFWSKEKWPPCSPDLNPMDFSIWSILEAKACSKVHRSVQDLKVSLERAWSDIPQDTMRAAVEDVRRRLKAVIARKGGHFE